MRKSALIFLLTVVCSAQSAAIENAIESCLKKVLKRYFGRRPVLLVTDLSADRQPFRPRLLPDLDKEYHTHIIRRVMARTFTVQVCNSGRFLGLPAHLKLNKLRNCVCFLRADSDALLESELDSLHANPLWDPAGRNLVVVKGGNSSEALARRIIRSMWTRSRATDNLVMVAERNGTVRLYTWFPYRQPDCGEVRRVVLLDSCRRGRFERGGDLFPAKVGGDLEGCELVAATEECVPYVFAGAGDRFDRGLEIDIMGALSQSMNFRLTTLRLEDMWTTSVNHSLVGVFRLLVERKIDMAFSCLMLNQERHLLTPALPSYYEDSLVWFVPSPTHTTHVTDVFFTFPPAFWLLMLCAMVTSAGLVTALTYSEHGDSRRAAANVLKLFAVSLYSPVEIPTGSHVFRTFIAVLFVYSMHITIAFQSSLFALYRQPHYSMRFSSPEQAIDSGLFVYLRSSSQDLYNQTDHALWNKVLRPGRFDYPSDFDQVFTEIATRKSAVALFIKTTGLYMISVYYTDDYGTPLIRSLSQKFATYPVTTYLSPGNPLFPLLEKKVHSLLASGLVRLWLKQIVFAQTSHWTNSPYRNTPLSMNHVGGAFLLLLLLLAAAAIAFLAELLLSRSSRTPPNRRKRPVVIPTR